MRKLYLCLFMMGLPLLGQTYHEIMTNPEYTNFYQIQRAAQALYNQQGTTRGDGYKQYKRWEWLMEPRVYPSGDLVNPTLKTWQGLAAADPGMEANATTGASTGDWTFVAASKYELGTSGYSPGLGRVNVIFPGPGANELFVGCPSGGLWHSTNGGSSWTTKTDGLPLLGVSGIAVNPSDSDEIYILTGDGDGRNLPSLGILKTTDGGDSWFTTGLVWQDNESNYGYTLIMDPNDSETMYAATTVGILKTTDSWQTYSNVKADSFRDVVIFPNQSTKLAASTATTVYYSANSGDNWSTAQGINASRANRIALGVTPADNTSVYALAGGSSGLVGVWYSSDSGENFALKSDSPNILGYSPTGDDTESQSGYDLTIAVSPSNVEQVHVGGVNTWKSTDGGTTWTNTSYWELTEPGYGYTHADIHDLVFVGTTLYCGSDGGLYESANADANWSFIGNGIATTQIYAMGGTPQDQYLLYFGAQDNGVNRVPDWQNVAIENRMITQVRGADGMVCRIDPTNSQTVYSEIQQGSISRSTDGGETWTLIKPAGASGGAWVTPFELGPDSPDTIYIGYQNLWKSTDQGDTWTNLSNGNIGTRSCVQLAIAPSDTSRLYVVKSNIIYTSSDSGTTWTDITGRLPVRSAVLTDIAVSTSSDETVWVTFSGYVDGTKVYKTTDAGTNWTNISGDLPNMPVNAIVYADATQNGLFVGTDAGVYYRQDNLKDWIPYMNKLPNVKVNDFDVQSGFGVIRAASFGRGVWSSPLYTNCADSYALDASSPDPVGITVYQASGTITSSAAYVGGINTTVTYQAEQSVSLQPGFRMGPGGSLRIRTAPCTQAPAPVFKQFNAKLLNSFSKK